MHSKKICSFDLFYAVRLYTSISDFLSTLGDFHLGCLRTLNLVYRSYLHFNWKFPLNETLILKTFNLRKVWVYGVYNIKKDLYWYVRFITMYVFVLFLYESFLFCLSSLRLVFFTIGILVLVKFFVQQQNKKLHYLNFLPLLLTTSQIF